MIKALIVDGDGVVLKKRDKYFSDRLREDGYDFPKDSERKFFSKVYPDVRIGKKSLVEEVRKYLDDRNWKGTAKELLEYWFSYENKVDQDVINAIQEIRKKGVRSYLASDHSKYRANDLWNNVGMKDYFDGHFFSCDLGVTKGDTEFYKKVLIKLKIQPKEMLFIDDEKENVRAAEELGINTKLYSTIEDMRNLLLKKKIIKSVGV